MSPMQLLNSRFSGAPSEALSAPVHLLLPLFWLLQLLLSQRTPLNAYVYSDQYWSPLLDLLPASNTTVVPQVGGSRLTASGQPIDRVGLVAGLIACLRRCSPCVLCADKHA